MILAYHDAKNDRAIRGSPLVVYLHLLDALDLTEFRAVKQNALAARLDFSPRCIRSAIGVLVRRGYLEPMPPRPGSPRRYRLIESRMP